MAITQIDINMDTLTTSLPLTSYRRFLLLAEHCFSIADSCGMWVFIYFLLFNAPCAQIYIVHKHKRRYNLQLKFFIPLEIDSYLAVDLIIVVDFETIAVLAASLSIWRTNKQNIHF